jgi:hypothetical protein
MIGHEAIADNRGTPFFRVVFYQIKVYFPVFGAYEYIRPVIASLDYMMRKSWCNSPGYSWHKRSLHKYAVIVKNNGMCPYLIWAEYISLPSLSLSHPFTTR